MRKGIGGHQSAAMRTDEWLTPPDILSKLGEFDLDPCSPINRPWPTAKNHFTVMDNGLCKEWFGRVWMNSPYGREIGRWLNKLSFHGNGVAMLFARTETSFFFSYIWDKADSIFFLKGRPRFYTVEGKQSKSGCGGPIALVAYGMNNVESIAESGLAGKHLPISFSPVVVIGVTPTWISIVKIAVRNSGEQDMKIIYEMVQRIAPEKVAKNQHWKEKVRQQMQVIRKVGV